MRCWLLAAISIVVPAVSASAEVTTVTIASRTVIANGQTFGFTGTYERLVGRIEFALDPADSHNVGNRRFTTCGTRERWSSAFFG